MFSKQIFLIHKICHYFLNYVYMCTYINVYLCQMLLNFIGSFEFFLLFISFNKLQCFNWMTYSGLIIKKIKKKRKKSKLRIVLMWRGMCYKIPLATWNFKVAPRSGLLVKKIFHQKRSSANWLNAFFSIWMCFWDRQGAEEGLTFGAPCI